MATARSPGPAAPGGPGWLITGASRSLSSQAIAATARRAVPGASSAGPAGAGGRRSRGTGAWQPWVEPGQTVTFGPVIDSSGSRGLDVVEADDEEEMLRLRRARSGGYDRHGHD